MSSIFDRDGDGRFDEAEATAKVSAEQAFKRIDVDASGSIDAGELDTLLNDLGASPGLTMIITGESLFNDGAAMVLFFLFVSLSKGHGKYKVGADRSPATDERVERMTRPPVGTVLTALLWYLASGDMRSILR